MVDEASLNNIFFLGAGASVNAGVNTTFGLVDQFDTHLTDQSLSELLHEILSILRDDKHSVDIEELLQIIDRLEKRDKDNLIKFYNNQGFKLKNSQLLPQLKTELKNFINQATSVNENKINYLKPLFSYPKPTLIFSVNYDTAIEQLCNVYKKSYTDGFDYSWNPKLFQNDKLDFHLYKLHGSIMWYKTDRGDYLKLPLPPQDGKVKLIFGEEAHHLILYPMQKWEFDEPLLEMMQQFRTYLEKSTAVIVVGYSFRDPYMTKIFHDAARKNRNLFVVLVSPNARKIYEENLRYYFIEDKKNSVPSSLENRVLCLQYKFEEILHIINDFSHDVRSGFTLEERSVEASYSGGSPNWYFNNGPLEYFIKAEFIDKANSLFDHIDWKDCIKQNQIKVAVDSFKMFILSAEQKLPSYDNWLKLFLESSSIISSEKLGISIDEMNQRPSYTFWETSHSGRPISALFEGLNLIAEFINKKKNNLPKNSLSYDLCNRVLLLSNFVNARNSDQRAYAEVMDFDPNTYSELGKEKYNQAASNYEKNPDTKNWDNIRSAFNDLEKQRLTEIIGADTFKKYVENILKSNKKPNLE